MRRRFTQQFGCASVLTLLCLLPTIAPTTAQAGSIDPERSTVLITGSNRGIGLAFATHYVDAGWNVLATARSPERAPELHALADRYEHILVEQLDVTDNGRIAELATAYKDTPIDVLINNAGIAGDLEKQEWGSLDHSTFEQVMAVNVFAPLKIAEAFADHVAASEQKKIISITSGAGSVSRDRRPNGGMVYGISKAALNMAMRTARAELAERDVIVALIAPGLVATDMLAVVRPSLFPDAQSPEQAVAGIVQVIEELDASYDGQPRNYDGSLLPW